MNFHDEMSFSKVIATPGQTLCFAVPFAHMLMHRESGKFCAQCLKSCDQLLKCSACKLCYYCSRSCQKIDWMFHKIECKGHQRVAPYIIKDSARLMLRVLIRLKLSDDHEIRIKAFGQTRTFEDLMSHKEEIKSDPVRHTEFLQLVQSLKAFVGEDFILPETSLLFEIYGKICINTFSICDREMRPIGAGLYLGPSALDHSCRPNAVVVFDGIHMNVNCIEVIYENQKVTISYIDLLDTTATRRESLRRDYYFTCECSLCLDDDMDMMTQSLRCTDLKCTGAILQNTDGVFFPCSTCGRLEVDYSQRKSTATEQSKETLDRHQQLKSEQNFEEQLRLSVECIDAVEDIFHPVNTLFIKLLVMAFDACVEVAKFPEALQYGLHLVEPYRRCLSKYHPELGIHLMKLGKIQLLLEKTTEALLSLLQAEIIIRVTHGSNHNLYGELQEMIDECRIGNRNTNELTE